MQPINDKQIIETARKYNLDPNSMKSEAFSLFDCGYSLKEIRFLLRRYKKPFAPSSYSNTLRRYRKLWESTQEQKQGRAFAEINLARIIAASAYG